MSWRKPHDGGSAITSYDVRHILTTDDETVMANWTVITAAWSTGGGSLEYVIQNLANGSRYDVEVRACNARGCGDWSPTRTGTPRTTPNRVSTPTVTPGDSSLEVSWSAPYNGGATISRYRLQRKETSEPDSSWANAGTVSYATTFTVGDLTNGTPYYVRVQAHNEAGNGPWSHPAFGIPMEPLAKPTGLDVTPLPLRKANLTWTGDANAATFYVEVEYPAGSDMWDEVAMVSNGSVGHVIDLDSVLPDRTPSIGLAEEDYFKLRVVARWSPSVGPSSDPSEEIVIIDNPLLLPEGRATANSASEAGLEWKRLSQVAAYNIRYGKLGKYERTLRLDYTHERTSWPKNENWPYYEEHLDSPKIIGPVVSVAIGGLESGKIHAFQVNYVKTDETKVFSARYAYVWPSGSVPAFSKRVGTYPFYGYWKDGEYDYTVCVDTFSPNGSGWQDLIEHAFSQWEAAVPDRLTVAKVPGSCTSDDGPIDNAVPMSVIRALFNQSNEVYMVDMSSWDNPRALIFFHNILFFCITEAPACVISPRYIDLSFGGIRGLDDGSVDVLVNVSNASIPLNIPHGTAVNVTPDPDDISFNTCQPTPLNADPDYGFDNYGLMVHEAGHALGLSSITLRLDQIAQPYHIAHPTIPDTVMNYDPYVPRDWATWAPLPLNEPDCSPHPFDVMAIEALYQTVTP